MPQSFAAEGGYQVFSLGSSEWFWLIFAVVVVDRGARRRRG